MKFPRVIALSIFSLVSAGTIMAITEMNGTTVDRTFEIKDIAGDSKYMKGIKLQNILQTDRNSFEKVIFSKNGASFEKTVYDAVARADEKILNNKKLYRGTMSPAEFENENYMMTAEFNVDYPYASNESYAMIAIKDKQTGKVLKEKAAVSDFVSSEYVRAQILLESEGKIYYGFFGRTINDDKLYLYIYEINPHTAEIQNRMKIDASVSNNNPSYYTNITTKDGKLYTVLYDDDWNTRLLTADPARETSEQKEIHLDHNKEDYIESVQMINDQLYVEISGNTLIINSKTLETMGIVHPKIKDNMDYISSTDLQTKNGYLYVTYEAFKNDMYEEYIGVYETETGHMLYEGKLPGMNNRGVKLAHAFAE